MSWARVVNKGGTTNEINEEHKRGLDSMTMNEKFFRQQTKLATVDTEGGRKWLNSAHLRFDTESLICAAQEHDLATNVTKENMWKQGASSLCRLCKNQDETLMNIVSGCEMLCGTKYLYRHEKIGAYLHWLILQDNGFRVCKSWSHHVPLPHDHEGRGDNILGHTTPDG